VASCAFCRKLGFAKPGSEPSASGGGPGGRERAGGGVPGGSITGWTGRRAAWGAGCDGLDGGGEAWGRNAMRAKVEIERRKIDLVGANNRLNEGRPNGFFLKAGDLATPLAAGLPGATGGTNWDALGRKNWREIKTDRPSWANFRRCRCNLCPRPGTHKEKPLLSHGGGVTKQHVKTVRSRRQSTHEAPFLVSGGMAGPWARAGRGHSTSAFAPGV